MNSGSHDVPGEPLASVGRFSAYWLHKADTGSWVVPKQPIGRDTAFVVNHEQIEIRSVKRSLPQPTLDLRTVALSKVVDG